MRNKTMFVTLLAGASAAAAVDFAAKPKAVKADGKVTITFAVSARTDVEVAVLDAAGPSTGSGQARVVRHLAAGVLGGEKAPPPPLAAGLAQTLVWDGKDDFGEPAGGGPFKVRVRAGTGVKFSRFIGEDPYCFGSIDSMVTDERGNLYVMGCNESDGQAAMVLRTFDADGRYLRTLIPFPADLPPETAAEFAAFDKQADAFRPINRNNMYPAFYPGLGGMGLAGGRRRPLPHMLVSASSKDGVLMTDGSWLCRIDSRGAVSGKEFRYRRLWSAGDAPGFGPMHLAPSPDGKWLYMSGRFSFKSPYGHRFNPRYPPGAVYRLALDGDGTLEQFALVPVAHEQGIGGAYAKELEGREPDKYAPYRGLAPLGGLAIGKDGKVHVADREHQRVAVFTERGEEAGQIDVAWPKLVAVNPDSGAIYVLQQYKSRLLKLLKFDKVAKDATPSAELDLKIIRPKVGSRFSTWPMRLVCSSGDRPWIYISGLVGDVTYRPLVLEDAGEKFVPAETQYKPRAGAQYGWHRIAVDHARDEVYASDGCSAMWRYDGATGQGGPLVRDGKDFDCTDLAVGYDGLLYVRTGNSYSGPLERYTRELKPAPFAGGGSNVFSKYIYSRMGPGYAERGIGPGPDGKTYVSFMFDWVKYCVAGFGPDGKALAGNYLKGLVGNKGDGKGRYPPELDSAVIGPITGSNGGVRVDLAGNIYLGLWVWPKDRPVARPFASDPAYLAMVGSVVKFPPEGGMMASTTADWGSDPVGNTPRTPGAGGIETRSGFRGRTCHDAFLERATAIYPGLAPFSHQGFADNTCCVCQTVRFDLDRFGRVYMPNAVTNSVRIVDNAGNEILTFGKYGNFDSMYVNPNLPEGKAGKPTVAAPDVPLAWPTAVGVSKDAVYVCDVYNRRAVRVVKTHAVEAVCPVGP